MKKCSSNSHATDRLNALQDNLFVLSETDLERIERHVLETKPDLLIIDSIQTIFRLMSKVHQVVSAKYVNVL